MTDRERFEAADFKVSADWLESWNQAKADGPGWGYTRIVAMLRQAALQSVGRQEPVAWRPIETAPRNSSCVLVAYKKLDSEWRVREAWWRLPYEGAPMKQCHWCYERDGTLLDASVHGIGATHWMPLPAPPSEAKP